MQKTLLNYLEDSSKYFDTASVEHVGGQPCDTGTISTTSTTFIVTSVKFYEGLVYHYGTFGDEKFAVGDEVILEIDKDRRERNSRLHSAGHLLDYVLFQTQYALRPNKGFHFPEGPYIEYEGKITGDPQALITELETKLSQCISQGFKVKTYIVSSREALAEKSYFIPAHIHEEKAMRVVIVFGDKGVPCGGTHVENIKDIGAVTITKIKTKGNMTKISYAVV